MPLPWRDQYASQITTASNALAQLRKGSNVFLGSGAAEPWLLRGTLAERAAEWGEDAIHAFSLLPSLMGSDEEEAAFPRTVFSLPTGLQWALASEALQFLPIPPWRVHEVLGREIPLGAALVQVSPPDEHGFCSLGPSVDIAKPAIEAAGIVVAEVNAYIPWSWGNSMIHVDQVQWLVEHEAPLPEVFPTHPDGVSRQIAEHLAKLISDEATLSLGMGPVPEALMENLSGRRNLGLHSEIFGEGMMALIEAGVILNRAKTLHPDRVIAARCLGSSRLYEYVHDNPLLEFHPSYHVCDPHVVAQNRRMTAINMGLAANLAGDVCITQGGGETWEDSGANTGLAMGATRAEGGRSIVALRSTDALGASRIGLDLPPATLRTLSGADVQFVVTEYGIAELWGRTVAERAIELINVAHPDHRGPLFRQAQERGYIPESEPAPAGQYPHQVETAIPLPQGPVMHVRPIKPSDRRLIREMFYALSDQTLYYRFFRIPKTIPPELVQRGDRIDYDREMTLVSLIQEGGRQQAIALSRYVVDEETKMADVALLVRDDYQRRGIGTSMLLFLGQIAQQRGLRGLKADILVGNYRALGLVHKHDVGVKATLKDGYYSVSYEFPVKNENAP